MDIYLIQHAQALPAEADPERPLSPEGRAAASKLAVWLGGAGGALLVPSIREIRHSGKPRARETAEILAPALAPGVAPAAVENMNPKDDPRALFKEFKSSREDDGAIALIGHLPHLSKLAGLLICGNEDAEPVAFTHAGLLKLRSAGKRWTVAAYVPVDALP